MKIESTSTLTVERTENGFIVRPSFYDSRSAPMLPSDWVVAETVDKLTSILAKWGNAQIKAAQPK